MNACIKKIIISLVFILIIGMNFISATSKIVQEEKQTNASIFDDNIDWWPMFHHDLNHSGYSTSTGPETNNVCWAYQADDRIYLSSPALVDNKIYFGDESKSFYCINASNGVEIWKKNIPYGIGSSSPAVDNGRVYFGANIGNAGIYCLNTTTGEIIWRYQTSGNNGVKSPAIYEGKVFIGSSNPEPGRMYCLDADNGEEIWIKNIDTPGSAAVYNGRVYFGSYDFNVYCLDADNGTVIWKYKTSGQYIPYIHVTIYNYKLYVGGEDGLYCLNIENGSLIWKYPTKDNIFTTPCTANGFVYFTSDDSFIYCLDANSGEKIWDFENKYWDLHSSPAYADGKIYLGSNGSKVSCFDANSGEKIWDFDTTSKVYSSPIVTNDKLYVGSWEDGEMFCFGGENDNNPPKTPKEILGPSTVKLGVKYTYTTSTFDPDGDQLYYKWAWSEKGICEWTGPFNSNETVEINITFYYNMEQTIEVIVKDSNHARSDWAELEVRVPRDKTLAISFLSHLFERYPLLERFLTLFLN